MISSRYLCCQTTAQPNNSCKQQKLYKRKVFWCTWIFDELQKFSWQTFWAMAFFSTYNTGEAKTTKISLIFGWNPVNHEIFHSFIYSISECNHCNYGSGFAIINHPQTKCTFQMKKLEYGDDKMIFKFLRNKTVSKFLRLALVLNGYGR